ncbi:MAG: hypothetical protein K9W46_00210 [Candidatus Heimdallarchaeum endolithica]|uniref:Uncharacterized protein n=1 Tax=Candidatus Heimdallarchaeum endolithica TaxID=2876572 RepID=A0A9Y1BRB6_9ARCH|nr:MAG: hypothetical protein K9W46_00210 [Candidatus Heimdallarchaeum endolithica]
MSRTSLYESEYDEQYENVSFNGLEINEQYTNFYEIKESRELKITRKLNEPIKHLPIRIEKEAILQPGNIVKIPKEIIRELNWKVGTKLWFQIVDEKIQTIEMGKIASSAEEIKKAMKSLVED